MDTITLRGTAVDLVEVERKDDEAVIGTTGTGKRFVTRADRQAKPLPPRHPYRVYTQPDRIVLRVIDPSFEEAEAWFLDSTEEDLAVITADGTAVNLERDEVQSLLSALPEDQQAVEAQINGVARHEIVEVEIV